MGGGGGGGECACSSIFAILFPFFYLYKVTIGF